MAISLLFPVVSTIQPNLFEMVINTLPRTRACTFSSASPGAVPSNIEREHRLERGVRGLDRDGERLDPEVRRERLRVGDAVIARIARRHQHARDVFGAERVDGDRGDERGVDPTRQTDQDVGEAVLADVVAGAEHERLVHLVHRRERRFDPRRDARVGRAAIGDLDLGQRQRFDAATRIELPLVERGPHVDVDDEQIFDELLRPRDEQPLFVEHERRTVEHELVLPADEIRVDDRYRRVGGARREHRLALGEPLRVVRRRVEVDDQLRAARGFGEDRPGRAPRVLADRDPDLDPRDVEERQRLPRRDEVPLFVEDAVVREELLAVHAVDATVRAHGRGVVQIAAGFGKPDDRGGARGARRDLVEHLDGLRDERGAQEKVFGRVPGDGQLREHDEIAARGLGRVVRLEDPGRVALEVAHDDVQLGGGHPKARHRPRIRGAVRMRDTRTAWSAGMVTTTNDASTSSRRRASTCTARRRS